MQVIEYIRSIEFVDTGLTRLPVKLNYDYIPPEYKWVVSVGNVIDSNCAQFFGELLGCHKIHCLGDGGLAFETRINHLESFKDAILFCHFVPYKNGRYYTIKLSCAKKWKLRNAPYYDYRFGFCFQSYPSLGQSKEDIRKLFLDTLDYYTFHFGYRGYRKTHELSKWSEMLSKLDYALSKIK